MCSVKTDDASALSFAQLRRTNVTRCETAFHPVDAWSPTDWACALAGEAGEACNQVKKLRRGDDRTDDARQARLFAIADELADVVIYADLLAARLGFDLGEAVQRKFDMTSGKIGSEIRLGNAEV